MNRYLNRLPSITIREGHRVKVYVTSDLELPAYDAVSAADGGHPGRDSVEGCVMRPIIVVTLVITVAGCAGARAVRGGRSRQPGAGGADRRTDAA